MATGLWAADGIKAIMRSAILFLLLIPLSVIGLFLLAFAVSTTTANRRHKNYLTGGIDLVDDMTQAQFGRYLANYFQNFGYNVSILRQDEETGVAFITSKAGQKRFVFAKRSRTGVSDSDVTEALNLAKAAEIAQVLIITNSVLSRNMDEQLKKQGMSVWDREKLIPYMGKVGARKFALQAIESHAA